MEQFELRKYEFKAPSGTTYVIREQNGADDDVLSNPQEAASNKNIARFIARIVVKTDFNSSGKLTIEDVMNMPVLDKYCILLNSRIFSLGETLEFSHKWSNGTNVEEIHYEQDLTEFLFDYSYIPEAEELLAKPNAIPFYPEIISDENGKRFTDYPITLSSGKVLVFDLMNTHSETLFMNLPVSHQTKNSVLMVRNLRLQVDDKFEKVTNFEMFSVRDMSEIRKHINAVDPTYLGTTTISNPSTNETAEIPVMGIPGFFFLED